MNFVDEDSTKEKVASLKAIECYGTCAFNSSFINDFCYLNGVFQSFRVEFKSEEHRTPKLANTCTSLN